MHPSTTRCTLLLAAALALAGAARAAPDPAGAAPPAAIAPPAPDPASAPAAADELLERTRGGSEHSTTVSSTLNGTVEGNTATNVSTGSNVIQGGAFANMAGIPLVVQNTGANVLIQNATTINLQLK